MQSDDFFSEYLAYTSGGEVPPTFHRWSALTGISALLERSVHTPFGYTDIHPNIYCMLIGTAGTRKSTAIKLIKSLLQQAGYTTIAAERTSKEKYLADLARQSSMDADDVLDATLFGSTAEATPNFIAADEANDFFGIANLDFLSILGSLWDWKGKYENKIKSGPSDFIPNPTVTILAGNTPTGFSLAFPSTILGQGFFSRLLLVYGEPTGKRVTLPRTPSKEDTAEILKRLQQIRANSVGEFPLTATGYKLLDRIYQLHTPEEDPRFDSFHNRRLTHLLKLALCIAASRLERSLTEKTILQANTYLTYAESLMPKALGEFGKAKDSDVAHKILTVIESSNSPVDIKEIWKSISNELDKISDLGTIIQKLLYAEKIQTIPGKGFLPLKKELKSDPKKLGLVAFEEYLTPEELIVKR